MPYYKCTAQTHEIVENEHGWLVPGTCDTIFMAKSNKPTCPKCGAEAYPEDQVKKPQNFKPYNE